VAVCARAAKRFRDLGCRVEEVNPRWASPRQPWKALFCGGVATRLAPYLPERRADIDAGLVGLIEETMAWGPTTYAQASLDRMAWWEHPRRLFETYDFMLTPTTACPPFKIGLDNPDRRRGPARRPLRMVSLPPPLQRGGTPPPPRPPRASPPTSCGGGCRWGVAASTP